MITTLVIVILAILLVSFFLFPIIHLVGWFIVGAIAGFIANLFIHDVKKMEAWQTLLLGICGSVMGGAISALLGVEFGVLGSIGASLLILYLWVIGHRGTIK